MISTTIESTETRVCQAHDAMPVVASSFLCAMMTFYPFDETNLFNKNASRVSCAWHREE
jgi:hypothetical protein